MWGDGDAIALILEHLAYHARMAGGVHDEDIATWGNMAPGGALSGASVSPREAVSVSAVAPTTAATTGGIPQGRGIKDGKIRRVDSRRTVRTSRTPHFGYRGAYAPRYNQLSASSSGTNADCPRVRRNSRDTPDTMYCRHDPVSHRCIMRCDQRWERAKKPQLTAEP